MIASYPCIVLEGVSSQQELSYLTKSYGDEKPGCLPFYLSAFDKLKQIGYLELNLDNILSLSYIDDRYKIWLYKSETDKVFLDHNDDSVLLKLIKL